MVSFHGSFPTDSLENLKQVKAKLLVCNGAEDDFVPTEQIDAFKKAMADDGINFKFVNYQGAVHSFTNPDADSLCKQFSMPLAYNSNQTSKTGRI